MRRFTVFGLGSLLLTAILAASVLVACGGGGGGGTGSVLQLSPSPSPSPSLAAPLVVSTSIPFSDVGVTIDPPAIGKLNEAITVPSNNQSATANTFSVSISNRPFNGLPAQGSAGPWSSTPFLYFAVVSSVAASFTAIPSFEIGGLRSPITGNNNYVLIYDPTNAAAGWQTVGPPFPTVSGSTLSFSGAGVPFHILAGTKSGLILVTCGYC
jgi:hypothetical protein